MKSSKLLIVIMGIIILTVLFGLFSLLGKKILSPATQQTSKETMVSPTISPYSDWTYFKNGYGIKFPPDWKNTSDLNGTAVMEPGRKVGSITKISITILSDKKATGQRFTTQTEFDQWYGVNGQVQGDIQKTDNVLLDGQKGVVLMDSSTPDKWTEIIWTRKDNVNIYIIVRGNGTFTSEDNAAIVYLISSFKFQAPASSGKSEK